MNQLPKEPFQRKVNLLAQERMVYRRDDTSTADYGKPPTYSQLGQRNLYVYGTDERMQPTDAGEYQNIVLIIYTTPDVDFQENDRIDYNNDRYEVIWATGQPADENAALWRYELEKV